jgi:hypothetical protein
MDMENNITRGSREGGNRTRADGRVEGIELFTCHHRVRCRLARTEHTIVIHGTKVHHRDTSSGRDGNGGDIAVTTVGMDMRTTVGHSVERSVHVGLVTMINILDVKERS